MSLNTAHANGGVLIHAGECILLFCDNVTMEFHGQEQPVFLGSKRGRLYLTTHRMIFNAKDQKEKMQSFSFPFVTLSDVEMEQPMFGANYIKGKCHAQPNGNWIGECKFKLHFKSGGAIEFGQAMLRAAAMAQRNGPGSDTPPPYEPPTSSWYAAPPPAYQAAATGYYGWVPPTNVFPDVPPANTVFMTDMPPPYPGINAPYASGVPPQGAWGAAGQQSGGWAPPQQNGAPGWANPSYNSQPMTQADAKAAEAAQSAYYDPSRPQCAYVPPPAYYESPPSFQQATEKKDQ
ncbi:PREDICTED: WW domain-binding protein 2 [Dufourea novaeangliae]|uniref:WW domain-binding protein 2 n=1 Tax=Dufourea novaeangliae TaxID=178035 RepID=A0A154PPZ5_DUFNO|nr:PREDICTED: WW domain-binding protein 2 [Dufourea novaeangliae]KZC13474.1 WW domain-binding protein 2 [Dufourea novaeangliae]